MITRIEISSLLPDTRAHVRKQKFSDFRFGRKIKDVFLTDVYTIDKEFTREQLQSIAEALANPVTQDVTIDSHGLVGANDYLPLQAKKTRENLKKFNWTIEIGFLPGVTDNLAKTVREMIEDKLNVTFTDDENVYSSQITCIQGNLTGKEIEQIKDSLHNPLIHRAHIKNSKQFKRDEYMDVVVPKVLLYKKPKTSIVDLDVSDEELTKIGKHGIANEDGTRRGPLALDLVYMKTIQKYFKRLGRNPTDIELESIAQTWSEHCKHTIFADPIDDIKDGLFKTYIKKATDDIRSHYAKASRDRNDICVSVFIDNSGAIAFDDDYLVTHKVETHNTPSALDPFGGAITGILGVNRDAIGFGMGAKPVINMYGFCFAEPWDNTVLYKGPNYTQRMLSSRRIMDGVIQGVNTGGNCTGIPTPQGFVYFDDQYRGKPLVFVGTVGLIPRTVCGKPSHIKKAMPGDYIVVIGGRVGKDGIHGATFSSEAMDSGSPVTAVQIGDPITQKKLSDAITKEARDMGLYNSITDNGAGGLSCSVAEMAKEAGGCLVDLEKVPLKYHGLNPWEIWISESQERMTLAVPKDSWETFHALMQRRGVEATIIGVFTDLGTCVVRYENEQIMEIDLAFLHDGLPARPMKSRTSNVQYQISNVKLKEPKDYNKTFLNMLARPNIASYAFISEQYDHIVQGGLMLPPLQGRGRVNGDVSVTRPVLSSQKGVMLSQALYPSYGEIDCYHMAASCIDSAIRQLVAAGANPEKIALLDNFCWCSGNEPERLGQLKSAAKACYDYATLFSTPYISGKDSMFNDFKGYDKYNKPITISIPPTLLISSISVISKSTKAISLDAKLAGDLVYILGETNSEMGGSEYYQLLSRKKRKKIIDNSVPQVDGNKNKKMYEAFHKAAEKELIASAYSVGRGGLAVALAKTAMGGMLGISVQLKDVPGTVTRDDHALFSESQGRILVSIAPENKEKFENIMKGNIFAHIGEITKSSKIVIKGLKNEIIVKTDVETALESYRATFERY